MADAAATRKVTRRTFLGWWMALILGAVTVAGALPILVYLWPAPPKGQKKGPVNITLDKAIDQLNDGEAVKFNAPTNPNTAFIMADGGGDNAAGDLAFGGFAVKTGGKTNVFAINVLQLLTGILLAIYYVPDARGPPQPAAYTSVLFIQNNVYLGWLIRGVHFWGANILILMVLLHMARVYWTGSYRAPRELNWMVGATMLLLILAFALTGYLLPWDTKAYFASEVTIKIMGLPPPPQLGAFIKTLVQGGPVVGPPTLQIFFTTHVFLLPALIVLLMYVHFRLIRAHGIAEPL